MGFLAPLLGLCLASTVVVAPPLQFDTEGFQLSSLHKLEFPLSQTQSQILSESPPAQPLKHFSNLSEELSNTENEQLSETLPQGLMKNISDTLFPRLYTLNSSVTNYPNICEPCPCMNNTMYCSARRIRSFLLKKRYLQVTFLELSHNNLEELPGNVFSLLPNLNEVSLSDNYINTIDSKAFEGLSALKRIDLSSNSITEIPAHALVALSTLQRLYVLRNRLTDIAFVPLIGNCSLQILQVSSNTISRLPMHAFGRCTTMKELWMDGNKISEIHKDSLVGLVNLTTLDLSDNRILDIQNGTFRSLVNLRVLDLSRNRLTSIEGHLFTSLTSLENLYLSFNWLNQILPETFSPCTSLKRLELSENLISLMDPLAFRSITNMSLPASKPIHSKCASLIPNYINIPLEYLDLSHNHLRSVPVRSLLSFSNMAQLNLESNLITSLGADFVCLAATLGDRLRFSGNRLVCTCHSLFAAFRLAERIAPDFQPECLHTDEPWVVLRARQCSNLRPTNQPRQTPHLSSLPSQNSDDYPMIMDSPGNTEDSNVRATVLGSILALAFIVAMAAFTAEVVKYHRRGKYDIPDPADIRMTQYTRTASMQAQETATPLSEAATAIMVAAEEEEEKKKEEDNDEAKSKDEVASEKNEFSKL